MKKYVYLGLLFFCSNVYAANDTPLVAEVSKQSGSSTEVARKQVDLVFDSLKKELEAGREVTIKNFGRFYVQELGPREGRNPKTKEKLKIDARRYAHFVTSDNFKSQLNPNKTAQKIEEVPGNIPLVNQK